MPKIYTSVDQFMGNTPLLKWNKGGLQATVLLKLEGMNPAGSIKDRTARTMLDDAEEKGLISPGSVIIEPTSGNTGIGLAAVCAARGYKAIIVMPDSMSAERISLMKAYGAEVVLTPGSEGMTGAIRKASELAENTPGSFIPGQFDNPANAMAHYRTTGPEIWADSDGTVDILVCGVGTGGTITGAGRFLKEKNPDIQVVAVEPANSAVLSGKEAGKHGLQGIGAGFVPAVLDTKVYDRVISITEEAAFAAAKTFAAKNGILVGISAGAALAAAAIVAAEEVNRGKTIVAILPDSGERYLSTGLFD